MADSFGTTGGGGVSALPIASMSGLMVTDVYGLNLTNSTMATVTNITRQRRLFNLAEQVVFGIWLTVSMILAIFGNLMVIAVVVRHRGMRTRTNMFLVSLAVADFLVGLLMAPFSLVTLIAQDWILGDLLCTINSFLNALCFITSIQTLMYISIHKYLSITRPLTRITKFKILMMIGAAWTWGLVCAALTTVILTHAEFKEATMQCGPAYPEINVKTLTFHIIIQTSNVILPVAIMTFAYCRMFGEIREHMQRMDENTAMDRTQLYNQQRRVTVTLFIVLTCFVLCWIPYCVYANYVTFEPDKTKFPPYMNAVAYCFGYMNSACNPIIYAWRSPSFREGYKEILCQEPSYVVSDDTVYEGSPSPFRRISTFITSVRGSRADESLVGGNHLVRSTTRNRSASSDSYKLLHKLTGKTKAKSGSSIIRRDGSVILVKNGKIVSMKLDTKLRKPSNNDDVFLSSPSTAGSNSSKIGCTSPSGLEILYESDSDRMNNGSQPLFPNGRSDACHSLSDSSDCEDKQTVKFSDSREGPKTGDKDDGNGQTDTHPSQKKNGLKGEKNSLDYKKQIATDKGKCNNLLQWTKDKVKQKSDTNLCNGNTLRDKQYMKVAKSFDALYFVPLLKTPSPEDVIPDIFMRRRSASCSSPNDHTSQKSSLPSTVRSNTVINHQTRSPLQDTDSS